MKPDNIRSSLKDKPLHYPGQSLDKEINNLRRSMAGYIAIASFCIGLIFWEWWRLVFHVQPQPIYAIVLAAIIVPFALIKVRGIQKLMQNEILGSEGEKIVGEKLEKLRQNGYFVFHDIICGSFNIDHIVVSPHGIFVIETKARKKGREKPSSEGGIPLYDKWEITSDGEFVTLLGKKPDRQPIQQAANNADWIHGFLKERTGKDFPVIAVVVFPKWYVKEYIGERVWVFNPDYLQWRIPQQPILINPEDIQLVSRQLEWFVRDRYSLEI
jgi:hypothetical protein